MLAFGPEVFYKGPYVLGLQPAALVVSGGTFRKWGFVEGS